MCGIVGYIGTREAPEICLAGLRRLEYRGYDSAGIAVVNGDQLEQRKEGARRHAVDAAAADLGSTGRFDSRRQPFLARLTAGWGCAQPERRGRRGTSP